MIEQFYSTEQYFNYLPANVATVTLQAANIISWFGIDLQFAAFEVQAFIGLTERWLIYIPLVVLPMAW